MDVPVWWHAQSPAAFLKGQAGRGHSHLRWPWEAGSAPTKAMCLQLSLAVPQPPTLSPSPRHHCDPPASSEVSAPELWGQLLAERQGLWASALQREWDGWMDVWMDGHMQYVGKRVAVGCDLTEPETGCCSPRFHGLGRELLGTLGSFSLPQELEATVLCSGICHSGGAGEVLWAFCVLSTLRPLTEMAGEGSHTVSAGIVP